MTALTQAGLTAAVPKTKDGKGKSSGYPDIEIEAEGATIYLEVKTYAAKNHKTTQRSFYLSPSEKPKISRMPVISLSALKSSARAPCLTPVAFEIVDLYGLSCNMKAEINSDNACLYEENRVLAHERVPY